MRIGPLVIGWKRSVHSTVRTAFRRGFQMAANNRLFQDWVAEPITTNKELIDQLYRIIYRARKEAKSNGAVKKFLGMCVRNIVFTGFVLQSKVQDPNGEYDEEAIRTIEEGWKRWCQKGICTADGKRSFTQFHRHLIRGKARDGEYIVHLLPGWKGNEFRFAVRQIPVECLDPKHNVKQTTAGTKIIMGIEQDSWDRPIRYHFLNYTPGEDYYNADAYDPHRRRTAIAAEYIIHSFADATVFDDNQVRGITWMHASMPTMHLYRGFLEAEVVAARTAACRSEYYELPEDWDEADDKSLLRSKDMEPGLAEVGLPGVKKHLLDPRHPNPNLNNFQKAIKRDEANSLDVAYNSYANDLENVNYSSIRDGKLDERDGWKVLQDDERDDLLDRVFEMWLEQSLMAGALVTPSGKPLPLSKLDKFKAHFFQGRSWPWIDPEKDARAAEIEVRNAWTTQTQVAAERHAADWRENVRIRKREENAVAGLPRYPNNDGGTDA